MPSVAASLDAQIQKKDIYTSSLKPKREVQVVSFAYTLKDLVADVGEIVRSVFYPEKILVKSGDLPIRSEADYDTFFVEAQRSVA